MVRDEMVLPESTLDILQSLHILLYRWWALEWLSWLTADMYVVMPNNFPCVLECVLHFSDISIIIILASLHLPHHPFYYQATT